MFRVLNKTHIGVIFGLVLLLLSASIVFAQDTDYCDLATFIEYGDVVDGTVDNDNAFVLFCFEGSEGDEVTIVMENTDGDLIPALGIGDQFLTEVFVEDYARSRRQSAEIDFVLPEDGFYVLLVTREDLDEGDTEGDFELSLDAVTAAPPAMENPCEAEQMMEYGGSERGSISDDEVFVSFCFEGYRGDVVSIVVETTRDNLEPIVALWDPFEEAVIEENLNSRGRDNVDIEYELDVDMVYMIIISRVDFEDGNTEGRFRVSLDAETGNRSNNSGALSLGNDRGGDSCNEYPLNILSQYQWGIAGSEPNEPLLAYNIGCRGELVSTVVGRPLVLSYDIDSRGNLEFEIGDTVYKTVSVDDTEWVLDTSEGDTLTLERLEDDGCDEEPLVGLIRGAWKFEASEDLYFDYGCNGVVLVTIDGKTSVGTYEFRRGDITIELETEVLEFADVEFDNGEMSFDADGEFFVLVNVLDQ